MTFDNNVSSINDLSYGDHLCCLYETEEEHLTAFFSFLKQSLDKNERVIYIADAPTAQVVLQYLRGKLDIELYLTKTQFKILTDNSAYMEQETFDFNTITSMLFEEGDRAISEGYSGLRVIHEVTNIKKLSNFEQFIEYNARLHNFFSINKYLGIFLYDLYDRQTLTPAIILKILHAYPFVAIGSEVYRNIYCIPLGSLSEPNYMVMLESYLNNLRTYKRLEETEKAFRQFSHELDAQIKNQVAKLAETNRKLKKEKDKIQSYFNLLSAIILAIDSDGIIRVINQTGCKMLGYNESEIIGRRWSDFTPKNTRCQAEDEFSRILTGNIQLSGYYEALLLNNKNEERIISWHYNIIKDKLDRVMFLGVGEDITERKIMEKALRENEETTRVLLNANDDAEILIDTKGNIITLNQAYARKFGKKPDELVGLCVYDLFPPEVAKGHKAYVKKVIDSGKPLRFQNERQGLYFDSSMYPIFDNQGKVKALAINIHDVTEKYKKERDLLNYQAKLRNLASQLSMAEEQERRRIASDLHDSVGQNLAFCKIKLEILRKTIDPKLSDSLSQIIELTDDAIQSIRSLTFDISPPMLYELGLEAEIERIMRKFEDQYHISMRFEDDGIMKPMDDDMRITVYRAIKELLANVIKHAHANSVKISIWREDNYAYISIRDDGIGFDVSTSNCKGHGLFSIREKLEYLGGCVEIESKLGHGTDALLSVPLSDKEA